MLPFGNTLRLRPLEAGGRGWGWAVGAALLVSLQTPLAAWYVNDGVAGPVGYAASWRLGVGLSLLMAFLLLRPRGLPHPGWRPFADWRFWLAAGSFLDVGLSAWAVSAADPLVYQGALRLSPVLFALLMSRQLARGMPHRAGWLALMLSVTGSGLALAGGWQSALSGQPWLGAGLGLANAGLMACGGFGFGWGRDLAGSGAGVRAYAACFCLGAGWGSLFAGLLALLAAGELSVPVALWGLAAGGLQGVCHRLALAGAADLSLLSLMPLGTAVGMLWLSLLGLSGAPAGWAFGGVAVSLAAVVWSVRLSSGR